MSPHSTFVGAIFEKMNIVEATLGGHYALLYFYPIDTGYSQTPSPLPNPPSQRRRHRLLTHSSRMTNPQLLPITPTRPIIVNRIPIIRIRPIRITGRKLPDHIPRNTRFAQHRTLPRRHILLPQRRRRRSILLQQHRLARRLPNSIVLRDPRVHPVVAVAPLLRVGVEGAVVDTGDGQVLDKVDAFVSAVGVAAVAAAVGAGEPAFVAEGDHVVCVEGLDVFAGRRGPVCDYGGGAPAAARLVAELPAEDRGAGFVAVDDEFDVGLVGGLRLGVGVEGVVGAPEGVGVGVYAA